MFYISLARGDVKLPGITGFSERPLRHRLRPGSRVGHRRMRNPVPAVEISDLPGIGGDESLTFERAVNPLRPISFHIVKNESVRRDDLRRLERGIEIEAERAAGLQEIMAVALSLD